MLENNRTPLKIALHGMDTRSSKTMMMFLQGPCRGIAIVVNVDEAEVDLFDGDAMVSKNLLTAHLQRSSQKPIIVLSLQDFDREGVLHVRKPVKIDDMVSALNEARTLLEAASKRKAAREVSVAVPAGFEEDDMTPEEPETPALKTYQLNLDERKRTSKHETAMRIDEKGFHAYIGSLPDIDVNDPEQFANAGYDPKDYFQGYLQSAFMVCRAKGQILQLQSGWKPISIFPHTHEIWLDADDPQLKAFAGIKLNPNTASRMSISPVSAQAIELDGSLDRFQSMDAFMWKLACWTSKGRYPNAIDFNQPVYLKYWPNFTRLLITPHALRIAALLVQGPRTLAEVAQVLDIKPQYVFVFASAAWALGIMGQARREVDSLVQAPGVQPNKAQGLLRRIMNKLRS